MVGSHNPESFVLKKLIQQASHRAGIDVFRARSEPFCWSHTVEDYYPVTPKPRWREGQSPYTQLWRILDRHRSAYEAFLDTLDDNSALLHSIGHDGTAGDDNAPVWNSTWFSTLDAAALVSIIAANKPKHYIEIGSGNSTRFARYTINALRLDSRMTSIDPMPRADIDRICDRIIRSPLESCDLAVFDELVAGDILFFDGSHRAFANSDVVVFFFEVMPRLKPGVLVHIHDILVPNDYPAAWNRRLYNDNICLLRCSCAAIRPFGSSLPLLSSVRTRP